MTVGDPVSKEGAAEPDALGLVDDGAGAAGAAAAIPEDSSMEREAMAPGAGVSEAGMPVGGCCFFLIMSL